MKLSCIIVDDEPVSRDILKKYIMDISSLELLRECRDAFEASDVIAEYNPDLIFLDINMPRLSGISLARSLSSSPLLVFTTAYPEYAVEGFDLDAVDYLVKPFSFERFLKAVNRALEKKSSKASGIEEESMLIRSDKKVFAIKASGILYIEGCGDYIKLVLEDKTLIVHETIKGFTEKLAPGDFIRAHRSYLVRLDKIDHIEGNMLAVRGHKIPVNPTARQELMERLK